MNFEVWILGWMILFMICYWRQEHYVPECWWTLTYFVIYSMFGRCCLSEWSCHVSQFLDGAYGDSLQQIVLHHFLFEFSKAWKKQIFYELFTVQQDTWKFNCSSTLYNTNFLLYTMQSETFCIQTQRFNIFSSVALHLTQLLLHLKHSPKYFRQFFRLSLNELIVLSNVFQTEGFL